MTPAEPKLGIHFGCLAEPIKKQLNDQGFTLESKDEEYLQRVADAINFLKFGYITRSVVQSAQKKLMKKIVAAAKPIKEEGAVIMGQMIDVNKKGAIKCQDTERKQKAAKCKKCIHCQGLWFDQSGKILEQVECDA